MSTSISHFIAYLHSAEEALNQYDASSSWITKEERVRRQEVYGKNILSHKQHIPTRVKFLQQFKDLMIILLIVSAGIAWWLDDLRTTLILCALVLVNAIIGYLQEAKAERLLERLRNMVYAKAKALIDGAPQEIETTDIVPGDILVIAEGDAIPADIRLLEERNLQTNDFSLTGESNPKRKHIHKLNTEVELWDRTNLCFMGTTVATGNGLWVVIWTGMNTELWRIASLSTEVSRDISPLQKEMNHTAKMLTYSTLVIGVLLFCIALWLDREIQTALLFAIGIAASMVPQGLPAQISIALASSAGILAKKMALVKKLSSVETLWAVNVICTDKTGTLTTNEMTVQQLWFDGQTYQVTGIGYEPYGTILDEQKKKVIDNEYLELFLSVWVLASNARIHAPDELHHNRYVLGDPTEWALLTLWGKFGITYEEFDARFPLQQEFCFDSWRKRMSMVRKLPDGWYRVYVKWSLQTMLPCCTHIFDQWSIRAIRATDNTTLTTWDDTQASHAMRNLSYAYKEISDRSDAYTMEDAESWLIFLGQVSMIDPPRETVPDAISAAKEAHIKVVVITGDYALTAQAIGQRIGLAEDGDAIKVYTGQELRTMSDIAVSKALVRESALIFSRTSPEDKVRIVKLCKKLWWIVAVTGDGVNDAPALKQADIGVAMGKTWTDVAKEAAEIILLDDSFATLVEAIRQGRIIYQNIKKNVLSCITTNWSELFAVLFGLAGNIFGNIAMSITAVQILAIDLLGEMGPLAAIARDPAAPGLMQEPARNTKLHMLRKGPMIDIVLSWLVMGICSYLWFLILTNRGSAKDILTISQGQTTVYLTIILSQFVNIFSRRSEQATFFSSYLRSNKRLLKMVWLSLILILCITSIGALSQRFLFANPGILWRGCAIVSAIMYGLWRRFLKNRWLSLSA